MVAAQFIEAQRLTYQHLLIWCTLVEYHNTVQEFADIEAFATVRNTDNVPNGASLSDIKARYEKRNRDAAEFLTITKKAYPQEYEILAKRYASGINGQISFIPKVGFPISEYREDKGTLPDYMLYAANDDLTNISNHTTFIKHRDLKYMEDAVRTAKAREQGTTGGGSIFPFVLAGLGAYLILK